MKLTTTADKYELKNNKIVTGHGLAFSQKGDTFMRVTTGQTQGQTSLLDIACPILTDADREDQ